MRDLITVAQASELILNSPLRSTTASVPLECAHGRILREPIHADRPLPPFDRVMMDGIAISRNHQTASLHSSPSDLSLSSTSTPSPIPIEATQAAGAPQITLENPHAGIEVMTGAPLPKHTDCVIPVEHYQLKDGNAYLTSEATFHHYQSVHPMGSDCQQAATLLEAGTYLRAPELGIAASVGATALSVSKLPRLTILSTGDEVIPPSETPRPEQIRQSHPTVLTQLLQTHQLAAPQHQHLPDRQVDIEEAIKEQLESTDFIVLTGGISKGKFDYVAPALRKLCGEPLFHGVQQRPGKPFAYWRHNNTQIFALPGNPVSVLATTARYLLPALTQYLGGPQRQFSLPLQSDRHWPSPFTGLLPSRLHNHELFVETKFNSGDYISLRGIDGFTEIDSGFHNHAKRFIFYPI